MLVAKMKKADRCEAETTRVWVELTLGSTIILRTLRKSKIQGHMLACVLKA